MKWMLFLLAMLFPMLSIVPCQAYEVDLLDEPLYDSDGHYYGGDISVVNQTKHPMYANAILIVAENVINGLYTGTVELAPKATVYLGRVQQADSSKKWKYQVEHYWKPDCDLPRTDNHPSCKSNENQGPVKDWSANIRD